MFKKIAITISAAAFVILAIAFAPVVPTALATAHTITINDDGKLNRSLGAQSCAAFEVWFLDPACSQGHAKKVARAKHHLVHK